MLKAVVFDLDGTLIDSTEAIIRSFFHTFETVGIEAPSRQVIYDSISIPLETQFEQLCDGDPIELCKVYREHYFETSPEHTFLLSRVEETLERISGAGLRLAIATSKSLRGSEILLKHLNVIDRFEFIVGADSVMNHKPHPEALEQSMERLGIGPQEMVYVGDTRFDTEASERAGVDCVAVATGYASRAELELLSPKYVADTMFEAGDYIIRSCQS